MTPLVIPPSVVRESHILDGLNLADGVVFDLAEAPAWTPGPLRLDWVGGTDSDGTVPLDEGHTDNATLTLPLRVQEQATADDAWRQVGLLVAKLEQTRRSRTGLVDLWTPKGATDTWEITVRSGFIADMPTDSRGDLAGYLDRSPRCTVVLTCDPFIYRDGEVIEYDEVTSSEPVFSIVLDDVPGHVPAQATVTVTDAATQSRRHVEGGMGEDSAAALLIDSASLVAIAGTATTRTGGYSSNGVIRATLAAQPQAVCGTGNLGHVGVHRPKARIWASSLDIRLRLAYRTGDGQYSYTPWVAPVVEDAFCEVELGMVTIREVSRGAQQWDGRIEAYSATGGTLDIDYYLMLSAERWWKVPTIYRYQAGALAARDEFTGTTAAAALNGRVAPLGGTWATSGSATDFAAADSPLATDETIVRSTTTDAGSPRYAILGATNYADSEAGVDIRGVGGVQQGVIARWTNASNHLLLLLLGQPGTSQWELTLYKMVGGSLSVLGTTAAPGTFDKWYRLRLVTHATGHVVGTWIDTAGPTVASIEAIDTDLATGGALDDGKPGFFDLGFVTASTRYFDNFYAALPGPEPVACYAGRSIEIRHDSCERENAAGTVWANLTPRGSRVLVPSAGAENRSTRLWVKARRGNVDTAADANIADSAKLKVSLRPRYRWPTAAAPGS